MSDDEPIAVVIDIQTRLPTLADDGKEPPVISEHKSFCSHEMEHKARIDRRGRKLTCGGCGADLDPYEFISWLARNGDRLVATRKRYLALTAKLNELLAEEKRIKARVRRWREKQKECKP